jgi:4-amino-4-deoxy-L-arabinose transferase-like glycosyltransferase
MVLSVASVGLLFALASRIASRTAARIAAACAAVYGPFVYYSASILYPTLRVFLSIALLLGLWEAARRKSLRVTFLAGTILGIYALGRANILLFAPAAFAWLVAAWGHPERPSLSRRPGAWRAGLVLTGATILFILPATFHNLRTGDPTLITTNGGLNFYIGNGPMASGGHETPVLDWEREDGTVERIVADLHQDVECRTEAEHALGRSLTYTEVSSFWMGATWKFIREHPSVSFSRLAMKASHFWSTYEIPQIEHFGYFRQFSIPLKGPVLTFLLIGPLSVVGMALGLREARRWLLLYAFVVVYSTSIILFFVLARYRLPVLPALLVFAGYATAEMVRAVRERRIGFVVVCTAAALVTGYLMQANFYRVDESKGIAQILYRHGIVEDSRGNFEAAIVADVVRAHGGDVEVGESRLGGARFVVTLPAS